MIKYLIFIAIIEIVSSQKNYCDPKYCNGAKHVACNSNNAFGEACPPERWLENLSTSNIQVILDAHNMFRNKIASGSEPGYNSAAKMPTLIWNNELASFAALNVKKCKMEHDGCKATDNFPAVGQNLAYYAKTGDPEPIEKFVNNMVKMWYDESKTTNQNTIEKCCGSAGHFTQMVQDQSIQIGCAISRYNKNDGKWIWKTVLLCCNYSSPNWSAGRVYVSGSPTSRCLSGANPRYPALCNEKDSMIR